MTTDAVRRCLAGEISAAVALAQMALHGMTPDEIEPSLPEGSDLARLFAAQRGNLAVVAEMIRESGTDHSAALAGDGELARIRTMFDRAVAVAPAASVAAYSLNDPALLDAATAEIVGWLQSSRLIGPKSEVLDLGCGIGRIATGLAPHVRAVLGLDISAGMIAEARSRCTAANLAFRTTDGMGATGLSDASVDLVLAVDTFPYLVQAGIAEAHVQEAARVLRPGGALVILNLSYRGQPAADRADVVRWCRVHRFSLDVDATRPFRVWDATAFVLRRPAYKR